VDLFDLERFVAAQEPVYQQVLGELRAGRKRSHWMWFVFPQIAGLGYSSMARRYAISGRAEATAYLDHPLLGSRLRECAGLVVDVAGRTVAEIFGSPDDLKFHSSMTLFGAVATDNQIFMAAIEKYFGGAPDRNTIDRLS
jgi:uncharacterized protein (DUF1810 family)